MTPTKIFKKLLGIFLALTFLLTDALPIVTLTKNVFGADAGNAGGSGPIPPTSSGTHPSLHSISIQGYVVSLVYLDYPEDLSTLGDEIVIGSTLVNGSTQKDGVPLTNTKTYMYTDMIGGISRPVTKIDIIYNQKPRLLQITKSMLAGGGQTIDAFYKLPSQGANENRKTLFTSHYINGNDDVLNINAEPKLEFIRVLSWLTGEAISYRLKNGKTLDSHAAKSPAPGIPQFPSDTVETIPQGTTYAQLVAEGKLAFHVEPMIQIKDIGSRTYNTLSASMVYHHSKSIKNRNNYFSLIPLAFNRYKSLHLLKEAVGTEPYKVSKILKGFNTYKIPKDAIPLNKHAVDGVYLKDLSKRDEYLKYMAGIGIIKLRPEPSYTTEGDFEFALPPSDFEIFELAANPIDLPNGNKGFIDLETGKMSLTVKGGYNGNPNGYKGTATDEDNI